jgi:ubiquinone/menaquinone biosynthesis C-methylase UbiE
MKINLGCGFNKIPGYVNIDSCPLVKPDEVVDLEKRIMRCKGQRDETGQILPNIFEVTHQILDYPSNSVEEVMATHILEHIHNLIPLMNEIYRVLKPGGTLKIRVPHSLSLEATQDPTHVRFFNQNSWQYFTKETAQAFPGYGIKTDFVIKKNSVVGAENIVELMKRKV